MAKTRCPQCSAEFDRQGDFCPECGFALTFDQQQEEEVPEEHSERVPGEAAPPPPAPPEEPAEPTIVMPVVPPKETLQKTRPLPRVPPPAARPPKAPRVRRPLNIPPAVLWVGLVVGIVLLVGSLGVWALATGRIEWPKADSSSGNESSAGQSGTDQQTGTNGSTGETDGGAEGDDVNQSYETLVDAYSKIGELSAEVGVANTDGTYGGTGFAYDVFNSLIGDKHRADRESLVTQCEELLAKVAGARLEFESKNVAGEYEDQKRALLNLYSLLEQRVQVFLNAAREAVDHPDKASWRPLLSPASTDLRKQFEKEYPLAEPVQK